LGRRRTNFFPCFPHPECVKLFHDPRQLSFSHYRPLILPVSKPWKDGPVVSCEQSQPPGILVTDDEDGIRGFLAAFLSAKGYAVWTAADAEKTLEVYAAHRDAINLVLLDVRMPDQDGPAVLCALRRINPELRCCFMTGAAGNYSQDELLRLGALHVFSKPFLSLDEVASRLRDLTARV
jgi:CheY-like chemotaxis protein